MTTSQDQHERDFLERFRNAYLFFPEGKIIKGIPGQEPDFIVANPRERVGIEMARLFRDDGDMMGPLCMSAQFQFQKILLEEAERIFRRTSEMRYKVVVSFTERSGIQAKALVSLAQFLVERICEWVSRRPPGMDPLLIGPGMLEPHQDTFQLVQVYDRSEYFDYSWSVQSAFGVEPMNQDLLHKIIQQKESIRRGGHYLNCDRLWLLIYLDFFNPAMDQQFPDRFAEPIRPHGFDKVILFKTVEDQCRVLFPEPLLNSV